jgi:hypothetical protein
VVLPPQSTISTSQEQAYSRAYRERTVKRSSSASFLSGTTAMGSPSSLLVSANAQQQSMQPPSPTEAKLGFFQRLRSKFRRSPSPSLPVDAGLGIVPEAKPTQEGERAAPHEEEEENHEPASVVVSLNPFKRRKRRDNEDDLYEAVDHWTDDW